MVLFSFIVFIYIYISEQKNIKNGVYNLIVDNLYLYYLKRKIYLYDIFKHPNTFFRIKRIYKNNNDTFFNIEEIYPNYKLGYLENKEVSFIKKKDDSQLWKFILLNSTEFAIQNIEGCFIIINNFKFLCEKTYINQAARFKLTRIYSEIDEKAKHYNLKLLNKEPIDILIKYIDLRDPHLSRDNIHQIEKDLDNEELRYCIRSILNNIPWIRKIFIVMPNEKVRYFKDYNLISERIIYVKDKDLLGYDSSNSLAFQFRYWKMKKFGISDNIIVMDDDCFVGRKLKKKDFFYVKNGKVNPLIITSNFLKINKSYSEQNCESYEIKAKSSKEEQNNDIFNYSKYLTFLFILNLFNISLNKSIFIPKFTHNAIPVNLNDIKELYDAIYKSKFKYSTLDCKYRHIESLQFQMLVMSYTFIKYNRKVKNIPYKFLEINNSFLLKGNEYSLFCINKNSGNYPNFTLYKAKIILEYLFPNPSPYEIIDYSIIKLSYNAIHDMDEIINNLNYRNYKLELYNHFYTYVFFIPLLLILLIILKYYNNFTKQTEISEYI